MMYKTNSYKRLVKCAICELSYPLPKKGKINNSALLCPRSQVPVLIVVRTNQPAYFWTDQPCFSCIDFDRCTIIQELKTEFTELKVYGY